MPADGRQAASTRPADGGLGTLGEETPFLGNWMKNGNKTAAPSTVSLFFGVFSFEKTTTRSCHGR